MQALDLSLEQWLAFISGQHWQSIDLGLDRMRTMVARLRLERPAPAVITVAGTNGKGSTCVACEAFLRAQGLSVGTTLSPHIQRFNERIRINAEEVEDTQICAAFASVEEQRGDLPLTYFEFAALAALWIFKQAQVDVAILEIGLGGRLDAFNVIDADVAVITSIGLDHQAFLGDSLAAIGAEKAGILRPGQHVVLGPDMPDSVLKQAQALHLDPICVGSQWTFAITNDGHSWSMSKDGQQLLSGIALGQFAPQNILLAFLAAQGVVSIPVQTVNDVAAWVSMPGRMQKVVLSERTWLLDVAHNPAGAGFLVEQLQRRQIVPKCIVCGMLQDKDHAGVFAVLDQAFDVPWYLVDTAGERGMSGTALRAAWCDPKQAIVVRWRDLLAEVSSATQPGDVILVLGSFNVIEQFNQQVCTLPN
jgi:dihydrofolate synthase / folylpolyglutamate synthase